MIAFKYTKTDGAEYLSHLDLLRHIERTLRRAGIKVNLSEGFPSRQPENFLNNPARGWGLSQSPNTAQSTAKRTTSKAYSTQTRPQA